MHRYIGFTALLLILLAFRLVGAWQGWMNVSPLPALFLLSMACFQGRERWLLPLGAWVITDPLLNLFYGNAFFDWYQLSIVLGLAATALIVPWVKASFSWSRACVASLVAALLFYVVTNTFSFFGLPEFYERSWQGFWQAQWSGPVGLGPTWVFLRNACAANLLFTTFFLLALRPLYAYFPAPLTGSISR